MFRPHCIPLLALLASTLPGCLVEESPELPPPATGPLIASEEPVELGAHIAGTLPGAAWSAYNFAASEGSVVTVIADAVAKELPPGDWNESCEERHATNPVLMLRGPLEDGAFVHRTARLSDARNYAACDLDAQIEVFLPETGTYQILVTDMEERTGAVDVLLGCFGECVPQCDAGCPEGSACRDGACIAE